MTSILEKPPTESGEILVNSHLEYLSGDSQSKPNFPAAVKSTFTQAAGSPKVQLLEINQNSTF